MRRSPPASSAAIGLRLAEARVEDGAEPRERCANQRRCSRGRRVHHGAQAREVGLLGIRVVEEHAQQRRDREDDRDLVFGDGAEHRLGIGAGLNHERRTRDPAGEDPILGTDSERRRPGPHRRSHAGITMGDTLWMASRPRRVEDLGEGVGCTIDAHRLVRFVIRESGEIFGSLPGSERHRHRVAPRHCSTGAGDRLGSECHDEARLGVLQHERVLALRQRPQQWHHRPARPGDGDRHLDVLDAVLLNHTDPLAGQQAPMDQGARKLRRPLVEFSVASPARAIDQGHAIGPTPGGARGIVGIGMDHFLLRSERFLARRSAGRCRSSGPV